MVYKTKYESKIYILGPLGEKSGSRKSSCVFQFLPPDGVNQKEQIHYIPYNKSSIIEVYYIQGGPKKSL